MSNFQKSNDNETEQAELVSNDRNEEDAINVFESVQME